jgi:undecaprenyl-diphosphatase
MDFLQTVVLALVQGVTEFLPISSSGHLVLVPLLTPWADQGILFDIALHVGTLFAVMGYFWRESFQLLGGTGRLFCGQVSHPQTQLVLKLALATVPIVIFALLVEGFVAAGARSFLVLGITSIVFGLLLGWADMKAGSLGPRQLGAFLAIWWPRWLAPKLYRKVAESLLEAARKAGPRPQEKTSLAELGFWQALVFGLFQALAVIPGTSRSGVCMTAGRLLGFSRAGASRVALVMAIPTIALAGLYSLVSTVETGLNWQEDAPTFALGVGLSFISALAVIHILIKLVNKISFWPFVIYRLALGSMLLMLAFLN